MEFSHTEDVCQVVGAGVGEQTTIDERLATKRQGAVTTHKYKGQFTLYVRTSRSVDSVNGVVAFNRFEWFGLAAPACTDGDRTEQNWHVLTYLLTYWHVLRVDVVGRALQLGRALQGGRWLT